MPTPAPLWLKSAPLVFLLLWSSGFVVLKIGLAHADPLTFLALRYACVVALLAPLLPALRPPMPASPRAWTHLAMVGCCCRPATSASPTWRWRTASRPAAWP